MSFRGIPDCPTAAGQRQKPGRRPQAVVDHPAALSEAWDETAEFHEAFDLHIRRHGESTYSLWRALAHRGCKVDYSTLRTWRAGLKEPATVRSLDVLCAVELRYHLPRGYFQAKLSSGARSIRSHQGSGLSIAERRRLAWHLPDDFDRRPQAEREEILAWVREVVMSGATDYRRYQRAALQHRFALSFAPPRSQLDVDHSLRAPAVLGAEMAAFIEFKTAAMSPLGYRRRGLWSRVSAVQRQAHLSLLFGALAASPEGPVKGLGIPREAISFGLLVFPEIWDWYLRWRHDRRGFFTRWEADMLVTCALAASAPETGWFTQTPALADRIVPVAGVVSPTAVAAAAADWAATCARLHAYARARAREIKAASRVHHDPFEPILVVLEAASPVGEYRKIADSILAHMPSRRRYPKASAEAVRAFLMIRLGLHLGFRQRNLRELLFCPKHCRHASERQLAELRCGELRWNNVEATWEVFAPAVAFKNARSSFFAGRPFRMTLPDLGRLYEHIELWSARDRALLLAGAKDPGTFFVKSVKRSSTNAAYNQTTFYDAWRWAIQRYGIHNPWTGRGAIAGLLPHGPHCVRDVLATHMLKHTGSYEQASYAIQDTPEMVANHYGRFLPQDKASMAAHVLNQAWQTP